MQANYANYLPPMPNVQVTLSNIPLSNGQYHPSSAAPPAEMCILSADYYDGGTPSARPTRKQRDIPFGILPTQTVPSEETAIAQPHSQRRRSSEREQASGERMKKRQRLASDDDAEDEASKKARGRPRLDTKDETAADRRRTQIRMAQRAYRHRKEITILSLERQVQDLTKANEQMSNIFIGLHDYAVGRGILHREPEFGCQLKSATERFLTLARSIQVEENPKDEESTSIDGSKRSLSEDADLKSDHPPLPPTSTTIISQAESQQPVAGVWGYQVSRQDDHPPGILPSNWNQQEQYVPLGRHLILSRATIDNASFDFDFS